jgi:two-component system OmpR family response regulator
MKRSVAMVEDDDVIRANYADLLRGAGFQVEGYESKDSVLRRLTGPLPDLFLLDITLNGERDAGFEVCTAIRRQSETVPIVFLTSHNAEIDKISGLRLGADDFITKDVSLEYLVIRLEALFRRRDSLTRLADSPATGKAQSGSESGIQFDDVASIATWRGSRLQLPLTQYWMLRELCREAGTPRSHNELMKAARIVVEPNTITAHVKGIREEFRRIDPSFDHIRTERGRGYRWAPI